MNLRAVLSSPAPKATVIRLVVSPVRILSCAGLIRLSRRVNPHRGQPACAVEARLSYSIVHIAVGTSACIATGRINLFVVSLLAGVKIAGFLFLYIGGYTMTINNVSVNVNAAASLSSSV